MKNKNGTFEWKTMRQTTYLCTVVTDPGLAAVLPNSGGLLCTEIALEVEQNILTQVINEQRLHDSDVLEGIIREDYNGPGASLNEIIRIPEIRISHLLHYINSRSF